jgi:outer membrane lipopolysaccharide assembly protein LptE/RlpB
MYAMLKQLFNSDDILVTTTDQATVVVRILSDEESTSSVNTGSTQETRVYQLIHIFSFQLENSKGKIIYGPITLSNSMNDFVYAGQVIGNSQELPPSYQKLREKAIQQMLLLLSSTNVKQALHENQPNATQ